MILQSADIIFGTGNLLHVSVEICSKFFLLIVVYPLSGDTL